MAEKPVDSGLFSGPRGPSETNPLGLSLGFIEGSALVTLRDRILAPGLIVRALELELAEVEFPLNLEGGAEEFQRRSTQLRTLVVDLELEVLATALEEALARQQSPIHGITLAVEGQRLWLEAELGRKDGAPTIAELFLAPGEPREIRAHLSTGLTFGAPRISALALPEHLAAAGRGVLLALGERVAQSFHKVGPASVAFDPVDALLWALLPQAGWKIPHHDEALIRRLELLPSGQLRLVVGAASPEEYPAEATPAELLAQEERLLRALAREDAGRVAARAEHLVESGDAIGAFEAWRASLDASGGPEIVRDRLLALGVAEPRLHAEVADLVSDVLARTPDALSASLAQASIAAHEQDPQAAGLYEKLARRLKERGLRRAAGLAYRTAAQWVEPPQERARLLEESIALRPDDVISLRGLVDELPGLGRASAAVRAARRLANLAKDQETKVRAHVAAGELLRSALGDPVQAKRELERALKLRPDDTRALESLARAVTDQGDPKRASAIWERLIREAEARGQPERAAEWSVVLGHLWRPLDAEAALLRYKQAFELDPRRVEAYAPYAELCREAGRREAAVEGVERALPLLDGPGIDPQAALALRLIAGQLYAAQPNRSDDAIQQYEAALALEPNGEVALLALDGLYRREALGARRAPILGRLARLAVGRGELDRAAALWQEDIAAIGNAPERLLALEPEVEATVARDRGHRGLLEVLLEIAHRRQDPARSAELLGRRLLLEDPPAQRAELYARLGEALEATGRASEATRAYEEAVGLEALQPEAITALTRIYRAREDHPRLAAVLERFARLSTQPHARAAALAERAQLLAAANRDADAYEAIRAALELVPDNAERLALATELAIRNRDPRYAKEILERRSAQEPEGEPGLGLQLDRARVAELSGDRNELISALARARELADPASDTGRTLAARLASELSGADRWGELAELERRRGRILALPPIERAERLLEAARLSARLGDHPAAAQDVEDVLGLLGTARPEIQLKLAALQVLLDSAERRGDPVARAELLGRRAGLLADPEEQERAFLEQAAAWAAADRPESALAGLSAATQAQPSSLALHEQLGERAELLGQHALAARTLGRAAIIAEERNLLERALDLHARTSAAAQRLQDPELVARHDARVLELSPPGRRAPELAEAVQRLEARARAAGDNAELFALLGRRAGLSDRSQAAGVLLEQASLARVQLDDEPRALEALRKARELAPENTEIAGQVLLELEASLGRLGLHAEQAAVLVERADRASRPEERAQLYLGAAQVYREALGDRGMALSRAQAAVRSDPNNEAARQLRISLLREGGRKEALAEALSEEAAHSGDAELAASLWLEAAEVVLPRGEVEGAHPRQLEQALALARRAATATPRALAPLEVALGYLRAAGRAEEELVVLGQILERDPGPAERLALRLRRIELYELSVRDSLAAQAEIEATLRQLGQIEQADLNRALTLLPPSTVPSLGLLNDPDPRQVLLQRQLELAERDRDWLGYVRAVQGKVELAVEPEERAELRLKAGAIHEHELGDAAAAEREYLAVLAINSQHAAARGALRRLYLGLDRFEDLAQNLGPETLLEIWNGLSEHEPRSRRRRLAEALWPILERGTPVRAQVQLALADLYSTDDLEPLQELQLLEQVAAEAPPELEDAALERLGVSYRESGRYDRYVEVLRRRSEKLVDDQERARAIAEIGETLEWKLGDGVGAEREYHTALAVDPGCSEAQARLSDLLVAQDRFDDLAKDLGPEALERALASLLGKEREEARALRAAEVLSAQLPAEARGDLWLRVAEVAAPDLVRLALQRASAEPGPRRLAALDRYLALLEARGERGEQANALRQRLEVEPGVSGRVQIHLQLARLVLGMRPEPGTPGREAIDEEAERELRRALELDPGENDGRSLLRDLFLEQSRFLEMGRVLGAAPLQDLRAEALEQGDRPLARTLLGALAELSEGPARAEALLELIGYLDGSETLEPGLPKTAEQLYRAALAADPESQEARQGLRALLESEGRYDDIAELLGVEALRETVTQLRPLDAAVGLLPATVALAAALGRDGAPAVERASALVEVAALQLGQDDREAAELALIEALRIAPDHGLARDELRELLVAQGRLAALAEIDESLVAITATQAAAQGQVGLQIEALAVLAERRQGPERADTLVLIAALEQQRQEPGQAQARLQQALSASPEHALARAELETLLWDTGHYSDIVAALGPDALIDRVAAAADADPSRALAAVRSSEARLEGPARAELLEISASIPDRRLADTEDRARRRTELSYARAIWDQRADPEGQERVRVELLNLIRVEDDVPALLAALEDAFAHARTPALKGDLALERATLLALSDQKPEARALVEPLVQAPEVPNAQRFGAARMLVEDLLGDDAYALSPPDLALKAQALELLTVLPKPASFVEGGEDPRCAWFLALAAVREAGGDDSRKVAEALEAALRLVRDREAELPIRRRLQNLYEELGEWAPAETHASVIAEAEPVAGLWVAVSELRTWLDDRDGAKEALDRALELDPGSPQAHESLLRLAEQAAEPQSVITRLEAWAEADRTGTERERADRLLRAAALAAEADDQERAALLAERALSLMPRGDPGTEAVARAACALLEPLGQRDAMVAILTRALAEVPVQAQADLRLQLADLLAQLGRLNEATTVIEQGIHRDTPAEDPLLLRLLEDNQRLDAEVGVRRLLSLADRLGTGPAARRLRAIGAERAESLGEAQLARTAWSSVAAEVGGGDQGRQARSALVRLARELDDRPALFEVLVDAAEDALDPADRAALYLEAAEIADQSLDDASKAEALLRRVIAEHPTDLALEERLVRLLERHQRWLELEEVLAERSERLSGGERAATLLLRARVLERHLLDREGAARLTAQAFQEARLGATGVAATLGLLESGLYAEAEVLAADVLTLQPLDESQRLALELARAEALEGLGRIDEAAAYYASLDTRGAPALLERRLAFSSRHQRYTELATTLDGAADRLPPAEGLRYRLAAARVWLDQAKDPKAARTALHGALRLVEGAMASPGGQLEAGPPALVGGLAIEVPLLDLAASAEALGDSALRVDALRLYAQSLPEGPSQWRALLHLAAAERESGDLEAAEFTLRGVVATVRGSNEVSPLDRVEGERALGALLLARGDTEGAIDAWARAGEMMASLPGTQARAEILVDLAGALERAGRTEQALARMLEARALAPELVDAARLEPLIEAAGPSPAHAELLERRAAASGLERERAGLWRRAGEIWQSLERRDRALAALLEAQEAEPSSAEQAESLAAMLYEAERWPELARLLRGRLELEDLTDSERAEVLAALARTLAIHLGQAGEALELAIEARDLAPISLEILRDVAEYATALGHQEQRQDAWARISTLSPSRVLRQQALIERALGHERAGELVAAVKCLEEAIDLMFEAGESARGLVEHAVELHRRRGDHSAEARLLVKAASLGLGREAAALYSRAAHVRLDELQDRRGATAAFGAAALEAPDDVGIRRALIDLSLSLGDLGHAKLHARAAVDAAERAGQPRAKIAYLIEEAHFRAMLGEVDAELEIWRELLSFAEGASQGVLDELISRARAGLPPDGVEGLLSEQIMALPAGALRGRYRLTRARLLEEPLGRHWEAQGERELVVLEDRVSSEPGIAELNGLTPGASNGGPGGDDHYRLLRSMLDRSGRWEELADLEERRAAQLDNPLARSNSLLQVARFYGESQNGEAERVRDALLRALEAYPDNVEALSRLARLEVAEGAWNRAAEVFERLEGLLGPAWPAPEFELLGAEVARRAGRPRQALARLLRAKERDPGSTLVKRALAEVDELPPAVAAVWLEDYARTLDPVLDRVALLDVTLKRSRAAYHRGEAEVAIGLLEGIEAIAPGDPEVRSLRLTVLEGDRRVRPLLDALLAEPAESPPTSPRSLLQRTIALAVEGNELERAARLAARLADTLTPADPAWSMLLPVLWHGREGRALLLAVDALGGTEALTELSEAQRGRLAAALLEADRLTEAARALVPLLPGTELSLLPRARSRGGLSSFDRAAAQAFGLPSGLDGPAGRETLERWLARLARVQHPDPALLRLYEALHSIWPNDQQQLERLAELYLRLGGTSAPGAAVFRRLLQDRPTRVDLLRGLVQVLAPAERDGAAAVLEFFETGRAYGAPSTVAADTGEEILGRVLHESVQTPLAEVLALTALPLAAALPAQKNHALLRAAGEDPRLDEILDPLRSLLQVPFSAWIDPHQGASVALDAGATPALLIGELLLEEAEAPELRFHLARSLMLLQLGALTVERLPGRRLIDWMQGIVEPEAGQQLEAPGPEVVARAREPLGSGGVDSLGAMLPALTSAGERDLGTWVRGAFLTANRFGALYARDLSAACAGLRRLEPRLRYATWATPEARMELVRRWTPLSDLVSFFLSEDYTSLLAALATGARARDRF